MTLHLLTTTLCDRHCKHCCNKQMDLNEVPYVTDEDYLKLLKLIANDIRKGILSGSYPIQWELYINQEEFDKYLIQEDYDNYHVGNVPF